MDVRLRYTGSKPDPFHVVGPTTGNKYRVMGKNSTFLISARDLSDLLHMDYERA